MCPKRSAMTRKSRPRQKHELHPTELLRRPHLACGDPSRSVALPRGPRMSGSPGTRARRRVRPTFGQRVRAVAPPVAAGVLLAVAFVLPDGSDADRPPAPVTIARAAYAC